MRELDKVIYSALLHDIGKVFQRADRVKVKHGIYGVEELEKIIDKDIINDLKTSIINHHKDELKDAQLEAKDISYIIYEADNIAAASERREIDNEQNKIFKWDVPLDSIYNIIKYNEDDEKYKYDLDDLNDDYKINIPKKFETVTIGKYIKIKEELKRVLTGYNFQKDNPNSLIYILKNLLSYVPSSTNIAQFADISLYEHLKLTAGLASCMYLYCKEKSNMDYKSKYYLNVNSDEKEYIISSIDLSGVQKFIYTITATGAAKMLKARSFYLELLMENIIDEILEKLELTRANVIYSGGAHSYLLLPNTNFTKEILEQAKVNFNNWLINKFGIELSIIISYIECCANNFNANKDSTNINQIFSELAQNASKIKLQKYNKEQLEKLLMPNEIEDETRECAVCGTSNRIIYNEGLEKDICLTCNYIYELGNKLTMYSNNQGKGAIIVIGDDGIIQLPTLEGKSIFVNIIQDKDKANIKEGTYKRLYTLNKKDYGDLFSNNITTGLYGIKGTYQECAKESIGEKKIGVLRADVDNLGQTFKMGFINEKYNEKLVTLSRYSMLSNSLSDFFKYNINYICSEENLKRNECKISNKENRGNIKIIYSGGDDLFLIGAWDEILEVSMSLDELLKQYTNGKITISAGIALFNPKYPISRIAELVGEMESRAKKQENKNSITIFQNDDMHVLHFDRLKHDVMEKIKYLEENFEFKGNSESKIEMSSSMLYKLLKLFKGEDNKINKVKIAYLLGRLEEKIKKDNVRLQQTYNEIKEYIYDIIDDEKDVKEFIIALEILIYKYREER
ncbi:MAG: type III-A CRISPR-associated protein Cas10/Csm1 [Clostridia bacterium]|jgi:CRISPR-associated protein Csm1|nr:type III-A CRISPR-associated protein Cas10/Csm1 [Clostridia bacterium]